MGLYDDVANWRHRVKRELIAYKGGKCQKCGYDKTLYLSAFSFHHRDPSQKSFSISNPKECRSLEERKAEADKCDLLCVRCHAEVHEEIYQPVRIARAHLQVIRVREKDCPVCKNKFKPDRTEQFCCSPKCASLSKRKVPDRPTVEQMQEMMSSIGFEEIGRKYGVTGKSIKKWAIQYGLPVITRRYRKITVL